VNVLFASRSPRHTVEPVELLIPLEPAADRHGDTWGGLFE